MEKIKFYFFYIRSDPSVVINDSNNSLFPKKKVGMQSSLAILSIIEYNIVQGDPYAVKGI